MSTVQFKLHSCAHSVRIKLFSAHFTHTRHTRTEKAERTFTAPNTTSMILEAASGVASACVAVAQQAISTRPTKCTSIKHRPGMELLWGGSRLSPQHEQSASHSAGTTRNFFGGGRSGSLVCKKMLLTEGLVVTKTCRPVLRLIGWGICSQTADEGFLNNRLATCKASCTISPEDIVDGIISEEIGNIQSDGAILTEDARCCLQTQTKARSHRVEHPLRYACPSHCRPRRMVRKQCTVLSILMIINIALLVEMIIVFMCVPCADAAFTPNNRSELQGDGKSTLGVFGCVGSCAADIHMHTSGSTYCFPHGPWSEGSGNPCTNANTNVPSGQGTGTYGKIGSWNVSKTNDMEYSKCI